MKKTLIAIKLGKTQGIACLENGAIKLHKSPLNMVDYKFLLMGLNRSNDALVLIESVKVMAFNNGNHMQQMRMKKMLQEYQQVKAILINLDIPFIEVSKREWMDGQNLFRKLEEKEETKKRLGNAAVHYFGGKIKVERWNAYPILILRFGMLKLQTDLNWINERIEELKEI